MMKNVAIFKREITERGLGGHFKNKVEVEIIKDFTPKKLEEFKAQINKNKRVLFELDKSFNLTTKSGIKALKHYLIDNEDINLGYTVELVEVTR